MAGSRRAGAAPVDGNAWCQRALTDIRARVARGEKVRVVFDIDNTLTDGRARTLEVGKQWDQAHGTRLFSGRSVETMGHDAVDTAAALKMPTEAAASFKAFWDVQFWKPESLRFDTAIPETVKLARAAKAAGADVVYLTGRTQALEHASVDQLRRLGLPDADGRNVVSKPTIKTHTVEYRTGWLAAHQPEQTAFFFTESRRDVASAQAAVPGLKCVLLKSPFGGDAPVRPGTPVFRP